MLSKVKSILRRKGYRLYTRPFELNIVGIRSKSTRSNRFDDEIHVFYKTSPLQWIYHVYKATTDPGTYWLENPMEPQGTAILAEGQYVDTYEIGLHRGLYDALVEKKPVTIIRDYDRNAYLDFFNGRKDTGLFGINIHRALANGKTKYVDKFSAGCQVFEDADDFSQFMRIADRHQKLYGNSFTYTLIDFRSMRREGLRRALIGAATLGIGLWGYFEYDHKQVNN
jgi:hypothetical protein